MRMNESLAMRALFVVALAIAAAPVVNGVGVIAGAGEWDSTTERVLFGLMWVAAGAAMVAGLVLSTRKPPLGIGLVAVGALFIAIGWFWIPFITIPVGGALVFLAYRRARNTGWRNGAPETPA